MPAAALPPPRPRYRRVTLAHQVAVGLGACALAPCAWGAVTSVQPPAPAVSEIAPGVSYERRDEGGRVVHIVRSQPGRAALVPLMPGGAASRTGDLRTAVTARSATMVAAVNGDFFNLNAAYPSGLTVMDNRLISEPEPSRSALAIGSDGTLSAGRYTLTGQWQTVNPDGTPLGFARKYPGINRPPERSSEMLVYTTDFGSSTPTGDSRNEALVRLDPVTPAITPNAAAIGTVVALGTGGTTIPEGHVAIMGVGSARSQVVSDLPLGQRVRIDAPIAGLPQGASGVGGGPLLVDSGVAVPPMGEGFSPGQINQRTSRTAVGQATDGSYLLVTVEGPSQGRAGVTVDEQAGLMAGLGTRLGVAMDAGGSAQMVVGDTAVVPYSSPRAITTAVGMTYAGVRVGPVVRRLSPNGDRIDDVATTSVATPVAGTLSVAVVRRRGAATSLIRQAVGPGVTPITVDPAALKLADGPYRIAAELTPDGGAAASTASRELVFDRTLGYLTTRPFRLRAGRARPQPSVAISYRLARPARVTVTIQNSSGTRVRTLMAGKSQRAGLNRLVWNRYVGRAIAQGEVRIQVEARTSLGTSGLVSTLNLAPVAAPPKDRITIVPTTTAPTR